MMFKPEVIKQKKGENRRSENSRNTRCYHKTSKKCQGKTITGRVLWLVCALQVSPRAYGPQANLSGTNKP